MRTCIYLSRMILCTNNMIYVHDMCTSKMCVTWIQKCICINYFDHQIGTLTGFQVLMVKRFLSWMFSLTFSVVSWRTSTKTFFVLNINILPTNLRNVTPFKCISLIHYEIEVVLALKLFGSNKRNKLET